jgi:acyl-CoA reductase-like NAD-dependent aldehyde dehydrogenase
MSALLAKLSLQDVNPGACYSPAGWLLDSEGKALVSYNPTAGEKIASVIQAAPGAIEQITTRADAAFKVWREVPAPKRWQGVRDLGNLLREYREPLGDLVSLEMGKIKAEGHGEMRAYAQVTIGDPLDASTLMGPLVNGLAAVEMFAAITQAQAQVQCISNWGQSCSTPPSSGALSKTITCPISEMHAFRAARCCAAECAQTSARNSSSH